MPQGSEVRGSGIDVVGVDGRREGVEIARAIAAKHHPTGPWILNGKTKSVKFNSTVIVTSESTYKKKVANEGTT